MLRKLNNDEFRGFNQKMEETRKKLVDIQVQIHAQCSNALLEIEKDMLQNLEKWSMIEESVLKTKIKSKVDTIG